MSTLGNAYQEPILGSAPRSTPFSRLPVRSEPPEIEDAGGLLNPLSESQADIELQDLDSAGRVQITPPLRYGQYVRVGQNRHGEFIITPSFPRYTNTEDPQGIKGWKEHHDELICYLHLQEQDYSFVEITKKVLEASPNLVGQVNAAMIEKRICQLDHTYDRDRHAFTVALERVYRESRRKKLSRSNSKENKAPKVPTKSSRSNIKEGAAGLSLKASE